MLRFMKVGILVCVVVVLVVVMVFFGERSLLVMEVECLWVGVWFVGSGTLRSRITGAPRLLFLGKFFRPLVLLLPVHRTVFNFSYSIGFDAILILSIACFLSTVVLSFRL